MPRTIRTQRDFEEYERQVDNRPPSDYLEGYSPEEEAAILEDVDWLEDYDEMVRQEEERRKR
jgi:hypothetical protein